MPVAIPDTPGAKLLAYAQQLFPGKTTIELFHELSASAIELSRDHLPIQNDSDPTCHNSQARCLGFEPYSVQHNLRPDDKMKSANICLNCYVFGIYCLHCAQSEDCHFRTCAGFNGEHPCSTQVPHPEGSAHAPVCEACYTLRSHQVDPEFAFISEHANMVSATIRMNMRTMRWCNSLPQATPGAKALFQDITATKYCQYLRNHTLPMHRNQLLTSVCNEESVHLPDLIKCMVALATQNDKDDRWRDDGGDQNSTFYVPEYIINFQGYLERKWWSYV